ncbi:hypothetical protein DKX38_002366 [Salix brachista]|uniref:Metal transporter n=1 Tax=Salix brachista TaxID=2182728 RepID=A0A5N5NPC6_9ROSI|nr:hypothetical protein DKX38_002366 [Salix brachista]
MASLQQEQQLCEIAPTSRGNSKRIAALNLDGQSPPSIDDHAQQKPGWRKFLTYVGPGFLVSLAYLDPGNLETDLQAGANHGYELLWVILMGLIFALIIQSLAANLGVSTGRHLAELCRVEYPKYVKLCLWLLAELAVIAADIPEGIYVLEKKKKDSVDLEELFMKILATFLKLIRKLELLISVLVFTMAACFFGELSYVKPPASGVLKGMFIPKLSGHGATGDAIALLGALVMPHNLFLHSALVLSRKVPNSVRGINDACRYFLIESGFALFVAFLINVSIVSVSGTVCLAKNLSPEDAARCDDLTLKGASFLLKNVLGKSSSIVYSIALLASGQSSTITGTYAGQYIMQGFLDLKMRKWLRNLLTRSVAILPSLIVSIIGGQSGASRLIIIASMILSFELPFALIPLLKFSSSNTKMGPHKNSIYIIVISWILGFMIIGINVYYLSTGFVGWLTNNNLPKVGNVIIGIVVFPLMAIYISSIIYLTFRKDTAVTYIDPVKNDPNLEAKMESGQGKSSQEMVFDQVPYREDLADIPLPK